MYSIKAQRLRNNTVRRVIESNSCETVKDAYYAAWKLLENNLPKQADKKYRTLVFVQNEIGEDLFLIQGDYNSFLVIAVNQEFKDLEKELGRNIRVMFLAMLSLKEIKL